MLEYVFRGEPMQTIRQFLAKQVVDGIQWTGPEDAVITYRFPVQDVEIEHRP